MAFEAYKMNDPNSNDKLKGALSYSLKLSVLNEEHGVWSDYAVSMASGASYASDTGPYFVIGTYTGTGASVALNAIVSTSILPATHTILSVYMLDTTLAGVASIGTSSSSADQTKADPFCVFTPTTAVYSSGIKLQIPSGTVVELCVVATGNPA